jgi:hypothetical protein
LVQRFGSAPNLNVHFHMMIPNGVFLTGTKPPYFRAVAAPTVPDLQQLVQLISERVRPLRAHDESVTTSATQASLGYTFDGTARA